MNHLSYAYRRLLCIACALLSFQLSFAQYQEVHKYQERLTGFSVVQIPQSDEFIWAGTIYLDDPANPQDMLLVRTDGNGQIVWTKQLDYGVEDRLTHIGPGLQPGEFVFTGATAAVTNGVREWIIGEIDASGTVLNDAAYNSMANWHLEGLHIIPTMADGIDGYIATGFANRGYADNDPKSVALLRVDDQLQVIWENLYDTPQVGQEDFDMGNHVTEITGENGFYVTGGMNMFDIGGGTVKGTLSMMVNSSDGTIAWSNHYSSIDNGNDEEPGASTVYDANLGMIYNMSNSTEHHQFMITEIKAANGAIAPLNMHRYPPINAPGCTVPGQDLAGFSLQEHQGEFFVSGYINNVNINLATQSSPPFWARLNATSLQVTNSFYYEIPTAGAIWRNFGGFYAPLLGATPEIYAPEMMAVSDLGNGFAIAGFRDEPGLGIFDLETVFTDPSGIPTCNAVAVCYTRIDMDPFLSPTTTLRNDISIQAATAGQALPEPTTVACACTLPWPIHGDGSTNAFARDLVATDYLEYVVGGFQGNLIIHGTTVNTTPQNNGSHISLFDRCGNLIWSVTSQQLTTTSNSTARGVKVDPQGNIYVTGEFNGSMQIAGATFTSSSPNDYDIYFISLDQYGNLRWANTLSGAGNDFTGGLALDGQNNIYATGSFSGTLNVPGLASQTANGHDVFILKLNSNGTPVWLNRSNGAGNDFGTNIAFSNGWVYVVGGFEGTTQFTQQSAFPAIATSAGSTDAFYARYNSNGGSLSLVRTGGPGWELAYGVDVDGNDLAVSGRTYNTTLTTSGGTAGTNTNLIATAGYSDLYLAHYNAATGAPNWIVSAGSNSADTGTDVSIDPTSDDVYLIGHAGGSGIVFGGVGGPISLSPPSNSTDVVVARFQRSNGLAIWAKNYGGTMRDFGYAIDFHPSIYAPTGAWLPFPGVFVAGDFTQTLTMGGSITNPVNHDFFLGRIFENGLAFKQGAAEANALPETETEQISVTVFPNPASLTTRLSVKGLAGKSFEFTLFDASGKKVASEWIHNNEFDLERHQMSPGIYFYQLQPTDGGMQTGKLMIQAD